MADYTIERKAGQSWVALAGDLTASTLPELRTALQKELAEGAREVVFDLGKTAMLDSSGIGLLIATHNSLSAKQGQIRVLNVSGEILRMLQSMRLVSRLNISGREAAEAHHG
jgi:anti-anti-sigma factor